MEAAARALKVPKGSFESLQKSLLGLHGGSNGSCSEGFEGAKGQFRKPTKKPCTAAVMEAAARPLKVPKGSFESLQKSFLGRSLQEKLSGPAWRVLRCCMSA